MALCTTTRVAASMQHSSSLHAHAAMPSHQQTPCSMQRLEGFSPPACSAYVHEPAAYPTITVCSSTTGAVGGAMGLLMGLV